MFKHFNTVIKIRRNELLVKLTGLLWLCEKLIGWRVWTTYRIFPTMPVFEFLDAVPSQIHLILFSIELILLLSLIFFDANKYILLCLLLAETFSCLLDQTRLQPYEYQCIMMAFVFLINRNNPRLIPCLLAFVLAATYFYSGVGKVNDGFLKMVWENMILQGFLKISFEIARNYFVYRLGYVLGLAELLAGLGLFFSRTQKKSAIFLIAMHLFVLALIGPLGLNYNKIVWPWNSALIIYLCILFLNNNKLIISSKSLFSGWNKLVFILLAILPALNLIGCWDNYLSSSLYSGKLSKMIIGIGDTTKCGDLKPFFKKNRLYYYKGNAIIDVQTWGLNEMNTSPYPELRVLKRMEHKLAQKYPDAELTPFYFVAGKMVNNY